MRNVVVCCLDTVRADYFRLAAPRLAARADVTFRQCRAASGWSVPSHASMVTGTLPSEHGVHAHSPRFDALDPEDTVFGDLPDHRAVGVSANVYAGSAYGFDALFDEFVDVSRDRRFHDGLDVARFVEEETEPGLDRYRTVLEAALTHEKPLKSVYNAVALQLDEQLRRGALSDLPSVFDDGARILRRAIRERAAGDEPFVLFANFMDAHEPHRDTLGYDRSYGVPRGWSSTSLDNWDVIRGTADPADVRRYRELYAASIDYLDRLVVGLIDELVAASQYETTVVVTADHGENLGGRADDGLFGHVTSLTEGVLHVPLLLVNPPEGYDAEIREYVSHLQLRELVAGLARNETPDVTRERITAEVVGVTPSNAPLMEADPEYWDRTIRAAYEGERKVVWDSLGDVDQYVLDHDRPCWQGRAASSGRVPEWARDPFAEDVTESRAGVDTDAADDVDDDVARRLADLGYR